MSTVSLADGRAWLIPVLVLVLSWGASSIVGYFHSDASMTSRVTAVEVQQRLDSANEKDRLDRLERTLDRLEGKVDQLVFELTGRKP